MATRFRVFSRTYSSVSKQKLCRHCQDLGKDIGKDVLLQLELQAAQKRRDALVTKLTTLTIGLPLLYASWKYLEYQFPELNLEEKRKLVEAEAKELENWKPWKVVEESMVQPKVGESMVQPEVEESE